MVPESDPTLGATPPRQRSRLFRWFGVVRWIGSVALLTLAPKCLICVAGYLGFATGLGLVGVELCGGTAKSAGLSLRSVAPALGVLGLSLSTLLIGRRFFRARVRNRTGHSFDK